ncbi:hypothetical protein ANTPLA_LOCUS8502 [Anthophora plagiata]
MFHCIKFSEKSCSNESIRGRSVYASTSVLISWNNGIINGWETTIEKGRHGWSKFLKENSHVSEFPFYGFITFYVYRTTCHLRLKECDYPHARDPGERVKLNHVNTLLIVPLREI